MKKVLLCTICALMVIFAIAQGPQRNNGPRDESWKKIYRATPEKVFDLTDTKIDVHFDYVKRRMPGKVWLTLAPHFYQQDSLILDAKGMLINKVALVTGITMKELPFTYPDTLSLRIKLDKTYKAGEQFVIYVDYVARPEEMTFKGSAAIRNAKGLYFINADGKDTTKPIEIWTQGETEATSVWVPILDKNNQKTTDEITMTVPAKYVTLSNGLLKSSRINKDGTRTDYWKMDLPHSPYLFFMGVGDYAIIKDKYKNIAVDYYVEPKYASVARKIFGLTPEMIGYFSKLLGVEYPWAKYAQIVGRDYVSGAMENTTATLHSSAAYQKSRALVDGNRWESTVAHELFHQWFGDYVTAESWSNLTVNESFANYSQTLWYEYKYGKDEAGEENSNDLQKYLRGRGTSEKTLARFYYDDKESMFDVVTYEKGGRVLGMLRDYVGDSAFFKGLHLYLTTNKFKNGEAQQLRLAMEEVSGKDLNLFFNQWYYSAGHPDVDINYEWIDSAKEQKVTITQKQNGTIFEFPLSIDVYNGSIPKRYNVWVKDTISNFYLPASAATDLVNVDGKKIMLWKKEDHKTMAQYVKQFSVAPLFVDRKEALDYVAEHFDTTATSEQLMAMGAMDRYSGIRQIALRFWNKNTALVGPAFEQTIYSIARNDKNQPVRALAMDILAKKNAKNYEALFAKSINDSSYSVAGAALEGLLVANPAAAMAKENDLKKDADGRLKTSLGILGYLKRDIADADSVAAEYKRMSFFEKAQNQKGMVYYANRMDDVPKFKKVIGPILEAASQSGPDFGGRRANTTDNINWLMEQKEAALKAVPSNENVAEEVKYMKEKMGGK
ncbi:MAG: M1 family metallopeptidase [Chitinophagaceae bacterium]